MMNLRLLAVTVLLGLALPACCNHDSASSAKCKASADSDACQKCCKAEGRSGHSYSGANSCGCM